jgi:hypothetical protein
MEHEEMTNKEFKTIIEMIIMIIEKAETKEEALEKLRGLSIIKD